MTPEQKAEYIEAQVEIQRRYIENLHKAMGPLLERLNPALDPVRRREDWRDQFAAAALGSGMCPANVYEHGSVAAWAYDIAEAMLKIRDAQELPQNSTQTREQT